MKNCKTYDEIDKFISKYQERPFEENTFPDWFNKDEILSNSNT